MKRLLVVIVAAALLGKLFTIAVVRLAENTNNLKTPFKTEHLQNNKLENGHATAQMNIAVEKAMPPLVAPPNAFVPPKMPQPDIVKPDVSEVKKVTAEEKKEKERRKKRKKKLEEKNDAVAKKTQTLPPPVVAAAPVVVAPTLPNYVIPAPGSSTTIITGNGPVTTTTQPPVKKATTVSTLSNPGLANWISLLTKTPSVQAMTSFEALYAKKQINQNDYYQVLNAMIASSNVESKSLAIQGAALYQNIESFKILADESVNETNQSIKDLASKATQAYGKPADVAILNAALASGDSAEKSVAAAILAQMGVTASL